MLSVPGNGFYTILTSDGIAYAFDIKSADGGNIWVDTNGPKGPNRMGRDFFEFTIDKTNGIKPYGFDKPHSDIIKPGADSLGCSTDQAIGYYCAIYILSEGAMNY